MMFWFVRIFLREGSGLLVRIHPQCLVVEMKGFASIPWEQIRGPTTSYRENYGTNPQNMLTYFLYKSIFVKYWDVVWNAFWLDLASFWCEIAGKSIKICTKRLKCSQVDLCFSFVFFSLLFFLLLSATFHWPLSS